MRVPERLRGEQTPGSITESESVGPVGELVTATVTEVARETQAKGLKKMGGGASTCVHVCMGVWHTPLSQALGLHLLPCLDRDSCSRLHTAG